MIKKILLSLLVLIAMTSVAHAEEKNFDERKNDLAEVSAIRFRDEKSAVRIVVDMTKEVEFVESYADNPSRLIVDLKNSWLNSSVQRETELKSSAASKIRVGQFDSTTVRIVVESMASTKIFYMEGGSKGHRLVIDLGEFETKPNPELNKPDPAAELKAKQETELKAKQEAELKAKQEAELKAKQEAELKAKQEAELKAKQEDLERRERELEKQKKEIEKREREFEKQKKEFEKHEREQKEKLEREIKAQRERELKEKERRDKKDDDKKEREQPLKELDQEMDKITALKGKKIVIDPGHGGNDAGAIGPTGVMEKTVTLKVSLELKRLLEAEGATVILTRETDRTVSEKGAKASDIEELGARCEIANRACADIFISIHADSFTRPEARGTTGYYYGKSTDDRGQRLADCIRRNLVEQLGTPSRGTQPCTFYVVKHTDMPATLIELGFISNKDEEKLLDSKEGVQKAAQGILDGIEDYFG